MNSSASCCRRALALALLLGGWSAGPCLAQESPVPELPADTLPAELSWQRVPIGQAEFPDPPADNPLTAEKVALGRKLFFDPILSSDQTLACASCHQPAHAFASPDPVAVGVQGRRGTRNAPSLLNVVYGRSFSWDGRDESLERQVLGPLENEKELGGDLAGALQRLRDDSDYAAQFQACFPTDEDASPVTAENLARAIASFERTLVSGNSSVDQFRRSRYRSMSREARQGMWIFESRGGCWKCHNGPNLTDESFHNTGVSFGKPDRDVGRGEITGAAEDRFRFKTPSLRNVAQSAPYMHDGSMGTLREVVEFYNRGGSPEDPSLDEQLQPLNLTPEEVGFLVAFLEALSDGGVGAEDAFESP